MRLRRVIEHVRVQTVCSVALAMLCGSLAAWGAQAATPSAVPIEQEPAHRLVLQNEHVRVFEVSLPAGDATLWHEHLHDGVSVRLTNATVEDQPKNGKAETFHMRRGEVAYGATPTARTHRVRNVGETAFRNVYIELLTAHEASTDPAVAATPDPRVVFENDRVRALRRILAPGESTDMHVHALKGVGVPVTAGRLEISYPDGAIRSVEMIVGAAQWIQPGTTHRLKNVGDADIEIVDFELK
jgi:quercetin dioxygenase-like cupin family protein